MTTRPFGLMCWALIALSTFTPSVTFAERQSVFSAAEKISEEKVRLRDDPYKKFLSLAELYQRLVKPELQKIDSLSTDEIKTSFYLSAEIAYYSNLYAGRSDPSYVDDMHLAYQELEKRHNVLESEKTAMREAFEQYRDFRSAQKISGKPSIISPQWDEKALATNSSTEEYSHSKPAISISSDQTNFEISTINLSNEFQIIVVAGCHFAGDAASAIDANTELRLAFERANAIWIASGTTALDLKDFSLWKRDHPRQPLLVAYDNSDWQNVKFDSIPAFYFFKREKLVAVITGLSSDDSMTLLMETLRKNGFLDSPTGTANALHPVP
ncbi:hypothetical protein [Xanthomonas oryzae]|uniref:hypothetical protein n=1 Tax=Xanthomonas oryzae TaxID=347 RepID=UPI001058FEEB|nr:hypothetical protein [Xanthomonas oryzae]